MERVAFLVEGTGERLACLLNPESVVVRRRAGVRSRAGSQRPLTGAGLSDDPLLYTGGGVTTLELDLLFDVALAGSSVPADDVRQLTGPLWQLAENLPQRQGHGRPPVVHFVWGKSWSFPSVVVAAAERLESFTPEGAPRRSWLRLRLRRVSVEITAAPAAPAVRPALAAAAPAALAAARPAAPGAADLTSENLAVHELAGEGAAEAGAPPPAVERLDQLAARWYRNPAYWRLVALVNDIADPLRVEAGRVLRIPALAPAEESP
jgi:hypothetical protein